MGPRFYSVWATKLEAQKLQLELATLKFSHSFKLATHNFSHSFKLATLKFSQNLGFASFVSEGSKGFGPPAQVGLRAILSPGRRSKLKPNSSETTNGYGELVRTVRNQTVGCPSLQLHIIAG